MTYDHSEFASAAHQYLQRKALEREAGDAAIDALRMIAADCNDPVGLARAVLATEGGFKELRLDPESFSHLSKLNGMNETGASAATT
jgi:hypothetical protein